MKYLYFLAPLMLAILSYSHAQPLATGVYSSITVASNSYRTTYISPGCYDYWFTFEYNVNAAGAVPSGMTLYIRIDSTSYPGDSVRLWRSSDMPGYRYAHPGDTFRTKPLLPGGTDIYAYFMDTGTLYTSLVMAGTPDTAGQAYFCSYTAVSQLVVDDMCTNMFCDVYAGMGALDTVQGCTVVSGLSLGVSNTALSGISLYPNPAHDKLTISSPAKMRDVSITDIIGQVLCTREYNAHEAEVDVSMLPAGVYFIRINGTEVRRFVKQ